MMDLERSRWLADGPVVSMVERIVDVALAEVMFAMTFRGYAIDVASSCREAICVPVYHDEEHGVLRLTLFPSVSHYHKRACHGLSLHKAFEGDWVTGFTMDDTGGRGPITWRRIL